MQRYTRYQLDYQELAEIREHVKHHMLVFYGNFLVAMSQYTGSSGFARVVALFFCIQHVTLVTVDVRTPG